MLCAAQWRMKPYQDAGKKDADDDKAADDAGDNDLGQPLAVALPAAATSGRRRRGHLHDKCVTSREREYSSSQHGDVAETLM